ncbi:Clavaminate synthase-like protein [Gonapodya prolifera JEL478]|uniref:Clavaminate synthase-like protein n=1 Tax=Gonapodya prolifera (strain JEL478) TaxID=1344416 RepID=A0A139ATB3_GONPJ|nr:Clavaminate synthase-like protein [Gonapodya prolifera JEL478]|eukprot:KXS19971.1 Clavaminate synthase-like protein [Gonapodya prolifera JEL478]
MPSIGESRDAPRHSIPVVDLFGFEKNSADTERVVRDVRSALRDVGFMYVTNIGPLTHSHVGEMIDLSRAFFARDENYKKQFGDSYGNMDVKTGKRKRALWTHWGYSSFGEERFEANKIDQKEVFDTAKDLLDPLYDLPSYPDEFQLKWNEFTQFHRLCHETTHVLYRAISLSLGLPASALAGKFQWDRDAGGEELRFLKYPQIPGDVLNESAGTDQSGLVRAGMHTDYGSVTLLFQQDVGGLEVYHHPSSTWINVPPPPQDTPRPWIVVNTCDLIEHWTRGLYCSTAHRVRMPRTAEENKERFSIAYFAHANDDVTLEAVGGEEVAKRMWDGKLAGLPGHHSWNEGTAHVEDPSKVTAIEWLCRRMGKTRTWKYSSDA